jgi:predicted acylesterase/phospholipase RssA
VGESGVLEGRPRQVTVVAVRDTLVAKVSQESAIELLGRHPRVMGPLLLDITRRARQRPGTSPRRTIALSVHSDIDRRVLATRITTELARHGSAAHLWKARVDSHLDLPGVADSQSGEPADARLSQFLHEVEVGHDHVLFELDAGWSPWSMRATRQADRLVAVVSEGPSERSAEDVDRFFSSGTAHAQRVLVVIHAPDTERPRETASWTARWSPDRILHIRAGSAGDIERVGRFLAGRPIGLVLGGGGARGFAHLGVRRAMLELGIPIDMVGGSSIGAPLGVGIAMDWAQVDYERRVAELFSGILDYTLPIVSLVKGERITASIEKGLSGWTFEDLWRPFFCVSTNLTQSTEMVHRTGDVVPAVRASVSIPGVLPPVSWGEDLLVDGGVLNNLPADIMRSEVEAGTVIAVDVAPPTGPRAKNDLALSVSGWQALRALSGRGKTSYPGITALLMRTMIAGSIRERTRVLERGDVDLYLDLDLRGISLLDFDTVAPVAQAGYEAAMPRLEAWLEAQE